MSKPSIERIYTDGACSGNPGPGGWGVVMYLDNGQMHELGGAEAKTTNNRMELQAAIAALQFLLELEQSDPVTLYTDSEYVKNGITQWIRGWKKKNWKTSTGKSVLNPDLWQELDQLNLAVQQRLRLSWQYVRGHAGDEGNERSDAIAQGFAQGRPPALQAGLGLVARGAEAAPSKTRKKGSQSDGTPEGADSESASLSKGSKLYTETPKKTTRRSVKEGPDDNGSTQETLTLLTSATSTLGAADPPTDPPVETIVHGEPPRANGSGRLEAAVSGELSEDSSGALGLPMESTDRLTHLRSLLDTLQMVDAIADQGYLITTGELADLLGISANTATGRGESWIWRNWMVRRVRQEGNQTLWQLERMH